MPVPSPRPLPCRPPKGPSLPRTAPDTVVMYQARALRCTRVGLLLTVHRWCDLAPPPPNPPSPSSRSVPAQYPAGPDRTGPVPAHLRVLRRNDNVLWRRALPGLVPVGTCGS